MTAVGDEVLSPYWRRADPTVPVQVRQLNAFHTQGNNATLRWYPKGTTTLTRALHDGGPGGAIAPAAQERPADPVRGGLVLAHGGLRVQGRQRVERRHQEQPDGGSEQRLSRAVWPPCPLLAARGRVGQHRAQHLVDVDGLRGRELRLQRQHVPDLEHAAGRCDQGPVPPGPRAGRAGTRPGLRRHASEHARRQGRPADRVHEHAAEPERHDHDVGLLPIGSARSERGSSGHARRDDHRGKQRRHRQYAGERSAAARTTPRSTTRPSARGSSGRSTSSTPGRVKAASCSARTRTTT